MRSLYTLHTLGRALPALSLSLLLLAGCKKSSDNNPNNNTDSHPTGLSGTDNVSTIPQKIQLSSALTGNTSLPASADILPYMPPIGDQGQYGTCVAWATAYNAKTALEAVKFSLTSAQLANPSYQMSPKDLFFNIDDSKKGANDCNGTDFTPALDVVQARGVATLATAPYGTNLGSCASANRDPAWDSDAAKHKIATYRRLDYSVDAVKQEIVNKNPVIFGAELGENFMTWNSDAVIQEASGQNNGQHGRHAMCVVGYDNAKGPRGAFRVVNSWSNQWGDNGFIWVDYNYFLNGFVFNQNLFTASNDNQAPQPGPNPGPDPQPNPQGVDLIPWVYDDMGTPQSGYPTLRTMHYDVFNIGTQAAGTTNGWQYAYIYYNAYDGEDYGLVFLNTMDPNEPANATTFNCNTDGTECHLNVSIASDNSIAYTLIPGGQDPMLYQSYLMPTNLNGDYYLIMVADITGKFTEQDEDNNVFYFTDSDYGPLTFQNGVGGRKGAPGQAFDFRNPLTGRKAYARPEAAKFRTAVNEKHRNAYSTTEILDMLKDKVHTGDFAKKVQAYRANHNGTTNYGGVVAR